jgi:hypothetical protein
MEFRATAGHPRARATAALASIAVVTLLAGCVVPVGRPPTAIPSPLSSAQLGSPAATPSGTPNDAPVRPPIDEVRQTDAGSLATVLQPHLAVHDFAGYAFDELTELREGTEVLVAFGPLANEGLDWYEVVFSAIVGDPDYFSEVGFGWVAAGPSGGEATSLRIDPPRCPQPVTANDIGHMSIYARLQCLDRDSYEVTGVIRGCTDYWETDEPRWLLIECINLGTEDGTFTDLNLHFPPGLVAPGTDEGDIVRLVGHVDDPRASECRNMVSAEPPIPTSLADAYSVMSCRGRFVVTQLEITGHVENLVP